MCEGVICIFFESGWQFRRKFYMYLLVSLLYNYFVFLFVCVYYVCPCFLVPRISEFLHTCCVRLERSPLKGIKRILTGQEPM